MKLTADEVYQKLVEDFKIYEVQGQIKVYLGDVDIIVKARDVVGNIMQEWLEGWLKKNNIEYSPNENTQMPPDVFLSRGISLMRTVCIWIFSVRQERFV